MPLRIHPRSQKKDFLIAALAGSCIAVLGRSITAGSLWVGINEYWAHWADDIFTGVIAGIVLFFALRGVSARESMAQRRFDEIQETNHHVRNALQVINSSHMAPDEASRQSMLTDSVARIDRTLRKFNVADQGSEANPTAEESTEETEKKVKRKNNS